MKGPKIRNYQEGWKISGYVLTNAISSGSFMLLFIGLFLNQILEQPFMTVRPSAIYTGTIISLAFLAITGILLFRDIHNYETFFKRLIHPSRKTPIVMGTYAITLFGILTTLFAISIANDWQDTSKVLIYFTALSAFSVSLYTTYLLGHNKQKHHWNSFALSIHMLVHSIMAGGAAYSIADAIFRIGSTWGFYVDFVLQIGIISNALVSIIEFFLTRENSKQTDLVHEIISGKFKKMFWIGNILIGNIIPFLLIYFTNSPAIQTLAGLCILMGIYIIDKIWIDAPNYVNSKNKKSISY